MKILRLELCCFGPYVQKQVIDFSELNQSRLYLVTGDTGAGKTILFDAIVFCLYGDSSGGLRKGIHFRSQNAPVNQETYAKLMFEIHQEIYEIKRSPSYPREGKKTNKPHTVQLKMPNGDIYERPSDVNEQVKKIIGIDYEEFTSVVMIAQGRFDSLIRASSKDKEAILREIFHTHNKRLLQDRILKKANELKNEATIKKARLDTLLSQYQFSEEDYLMRSLFDKMDDLLDQGHTQLETLEKEKAELEKKQKMLDEDYQRAKRRNDLNIQLENQSQQLRELLLKKDIYEVKELRVTLLKKAEILKPAYEALKQMDVQLNHHLCESQQLEGVIVNLKEQTKQLEKDYQSHLSLKNDYLQNQGKIVACEKKIEAYIMFQNLKKECLTLNKQLDSTLLKQTELEKQMMLHAQNKEALEEKIKGLDSVGEVKLIVEKINNEAKQSYELYHHVVALQKQKNELETKKNEQISEWQNDFNNYECKNKEYLEATKIYLASSAGILASTLKNGEPCPVCGSLTHPHLASLKKAEVTNENLDQLKQEVEILRIKQEKSHQLLVENHAKLEAVIEQMKDYHLDQLKQDYMSKKAMYQTKKEALKELENQTASFNEYLNQIKQQEERLQTHLELVKKDGLALREKISLVTGRLEGMQVKDESLADLEKQLNELKENVHNYEIQESKLSKSLEQVKTNLTKNTVSFQHHKREYEQLKPQYDLKNEAFIRHQKTYFESIELFKDCLKELQNIEILEKEIRSYQQHLEVLNVTIYQIRQQLKDLPVLDFEKITLDKQATQVSYENKMNEISQLKNSILNLESGRSLLMEASEDFEKVNELKDQVCQLSGILNGQNKLRMTFESYILSSYFDEILQLANIRLKMMTNGRYMLVRSKENQGGNRLQGLDLLVIDYESGKLRDINSLSGGETFKAALCLALGMSDMMSAKAGSIQIDTLFIDEGFGSLDEKSLDSAIEALSDLQNEGKIIGIISHVSELKERIDAKIVVTHSQEGSEAKVVLS